MGKTLLSLPSGGLFSGIAEVYVNDVSLRVYYNDILKYRKSVEEIETAILPHVIDNVNIVSLLPACDREFILTNVYANSFSEEFNVELSCPACETLIKETFYLPEYTVSFLDDNDANKFHYKINGRDVFLKLPMNHKASFKDYLHSKSALDAFTKEEEEEIESYIKSEIILNVGVQKTMFLYCPLCSYEIIICRPCGAELFFYTRERVENEKKNILTMMNYFSLIAHQPITGLMDMSYKDVVFMWENLSEIKRKEAEEIEKARNK